jgi:hypothetical protein
MKEQKKVTEIEKREREGHEQAVEDKISEKPEVNQQQVEDEAGDLSNNTRSGNNDTIGIP